MGGCGGAVGGAGGGAEGARVERGGGGGRREEQRAAILKFGTRGVESPDEPDAIVTRGALPGDDQRERSAAQKKHAGCQQAGQAPADGCDSDEKGQREQQRVGKTPPLRRRDPVTQQGVGAHGALLRLRRVAIHRSAHSSSAISKPSQG